MANYLNTLQKQSQGYLGQLNDLQNKMKTYTPATASDALKEFSARVGNMRPQYEELRGMEAQQQMLPGSLMEQYLREQGGTTGLDPMARLNAIQAQMGNLGGTTNVMRDVIGQQQGRLEQMSNNALGMYQQEQAGNQQQYGNLTDMYKTVLSQIENEKQRQAAAAAQRALQIAWDKANQPGVTAKQEGGIAYIPAGGTYAGKKYKNGATLTGADAAAYRAELAGQGMKSSQAVAKAGSNIQFLQDLPKFLNPISSLFAQAPKNLISNIWSGLFNR